MNQSDIFKNYPLESDSFSLDDSDNLSEINYAEIMFGGAELLNKPTGGFPPIYPCKIVEAIENKPNDSKAREYVTKQSSASIKDILGKRRDIKPFI